MCRGAEGGAVLSAGFLLGGLCSLSSVDRAGGRHSCLPGSLGRQSRLTRLCHRPAILQSRGTGPQLLFLKPPPLLPPFLGLPEQIPTICVASNNKNSLSHFRRLQVQNQGVSRLVLHGGSEAESIQAPLLDSGGCLQSLALLGLHMHHPILCFTHHPPVSVSFLLFLEGHQSYRIKRPPSSSMISS